MKYLVLLSLVSFLGCEQSPNQNEFAQEAQGAAASLISYTALENPPTVTPASVTVPVRPAILKPAAKKCCPDCICGDNCQCAYPGQCLIKSATPKHCRIEITECYGDHCETRTYEPQMQGTETGKLYTVQASGTWRLNKLPGVRGWAKQAFIRGTAPVRAAVNAVQGNCSSCQSGGCSQQAYTRRGVFFGRR